MVNPGRILVVGAGFAGADRSIRFNDHERYHAVKTADGRHQKTYQEYKVLANEPPTMEFIGRCGTDQDLDMDQVINQSLAGAEKRLNRALVASHPPAVAAFGDPVS